MAITPSRSDAETKGSPGPEAGKGKRATQPSSPTRAWLSMAVDKTSCDAAIGMAASHVMDTERRACDRLTGLYCWRRSPDPSHEEVMVRRKLANSMIWCALKSKGASQPGKSGEETTWTI